MSLICYVQTNWTNIISYKNYLTYKILCGSMQKSKFRHQKEGKKTRKSAIKRAIFWASFTKNCCQAKKYFLKIVQSCLKHHKTRKSVKTESIIFHEKNIFIFFYKEEIKNNIGLPPGKICTHESYRYNFCTVSWI